MPQNRCLTPANIALQNNNIAALNCGKQTFGRSLLHRRQYVIGCRRHGRA
jgi:hypothetical protein